MMLLGKCVYGLEDFDAFNILISSRHKYLKRIIFHSAALSPRNRALKFAIRPRLSSLAEFLGLVTDAEETECSKAKSRVCTNFV